MTRSQSAWRGLGAMGLIVAATAGVIAASVPGASGDGPQQQLEDYGVLRVQLRTGGGTISFTPSGEAQPTITQAVTTTAKCGAATTGSLLTLTAAGAAAVPGLGLVTNGLGVRQKNTCSSAEGRVSGKESVTLALGSEFDEDVFVVGAELDIEGKFNAKLIVSLDGVALPSKELFASSDNGPDSGAGDNDRVILSAADPGAHVFRSMTLQANGGEIALEGGGDATFAQFSAVGKVGPLGSALGTADTILELQRYHDFADDLSCGEQKLATLVGGSATEANITRLPNLPGQTSPCQDVGVTFEILDEGVLLDKGTTGLNTNDPQAVHAVVKIHWDPQPAQVPLPAREINFDPADPTPDWETVQWCTSWVQVPGEDAVPGHPPDDRFPGGVLPWCLVDEHIELKSDGTVVQVQTYDGSGDPMWR